MNWAIRVSCFLLAGAALHAQSAARKPVLVELFTSEGCSSCPPADQLLDALDSLQPVEPAEIVVLSHHVDYWNYLGWKDPYSTPAASLRQGTYSRRFRIDSVYTPQAVIDGREQLVGNDARGVQSAIGRSAKPEKLPVSISSIRRDGSAVIVRLEVPKIPAEFAQNRAELWLALASDHKTSSVRSGENSGRTLTHVAVVSKLDVVAQITKAKGFSGELRLPLGSESGDFRVVAAVQEPGGGPVIGLDATKSPVRSQNSE